MIERKTWQRWDSNSQPLSLGGIGSAVVSVLGQRSEDM